jgi:hypothetical protein
MGKYTFRFVRCLKEAADVPESWTEPAPAVVVDAVMNCGASFKGTAAILEPDSPNPCLKLAGPLGLTGVEKILSGWRAWYEHETMAIETRESEPVQLSSGATVSQPGATLQVKVVDIPRVVQEAISDNLERARAAVTRRTRSERR